MFLRGFKLLLWEEPVLGDIPVNVLEVTIVSWQLEEENTASCCSVLLADKSFGILTGLVATDCYKSSINQGKSK
jgi:hypothetical protein